MQAESTTSSCSFALTPSFVERALAWAVTFPYCSYFTSNNIPYPHAAFPHILAVSSGTHCWSLGHAPFDLLHQIYQEQKDWLFGYFSYDLKNHIHGLQSGHPDAIQFPSCTFFKPDYLLQIGEGEVTIRAGIGTAREIYQQILQTKPATPSFPATQVQLRAHMTKKEYLRKVQTIQSHIEEGDCYELNLCQEFSARPLALDPLNTFLQLNSLSPTPFATFQRFQDLYLMAASPERFLKKEGNKLVSQPIKGTIRRGKTSAEDEQLKAQLASDEKELAENMMIVDLVRNDLARSAVTGSVTVEELFGIYSFRQVHQMISTVTAEIKTGISFTEAIRNAFPMGSMTGAPKRKVMELIEQYECSQRGLYSGAVGFISPEGDFDFNVVIRSLQYNAVLRSLSFQVGGAITFDSIPEKEYEECLLKASALLKVLGAEEFS
ncbi:anthranilate synthase component I family protein [Nafulsella turpanensis]|uniref:anthranilate synthase component I family protein n=1 Tax=Nafulsella turpanensis TaxID=1265690 RepID=UPI00058F0AD8|nr:anthranilate synthase component I family protein [Nafulsella turpanensis]